MKRIKKISLFLFLFLLLTPFITVHADNCDDVRNAVLELDTLENSYIEMDCANADDTATISECNNLLVKKSEVLEKIFTYNEEKICPEVDLSVIISNYAEDCSNELSSELKEISDTVMNLFFITAPFLLIIFGSLDFFKIVTGNNPEETKRNRNNFIKRVVAFVLLYLTPVIVSTIFSFTPYKIYGKSYICALTIDLDPKVTSPTVTGTYEGYKKKSKTNKGGSKSGSGGSDAGQAIAAAARECKVFAYENGFTYSFEYAHTAETAFSDQNYDKHVCCASLIGASIYKAGLYDSSEIASIYSESAGQVSQNLSEGQGWEAIYDSDELEPGDVIVWRCVNAGYCGTYTVDGQAYPFGHVSIYAGVFDGVQKEYSTGGNSSIQNPDIEDNFYTNIYNQDGTVNKEFYCGLRYPGK